MKNRSRRGRGFTLAELLIVVAIVAVLTAIAIPVFAGQMERSREATDTANIRAQYAEVMTRANETGNDVNENGSELGMVPLKQHKGDWQNDADAESLGNIATVVDVPAPGGMAWVSYSDSTGAVIHFAGGSGGEPPAVVGDGDGDEGDVDPLANYTAAQMTGWTKLSFGNQEFGKIKLDSGKDYRIVLDEAPFDATFTLISKPGGGNSGNSDNAQSIELEFKERELFNKPIITLDQNNFHLEVTSISEGHTKEEIEQYIMANLFGQDKPKQ